MKKHDRVQDANAMAAIAYLLGIVTGFIIYFVGQKNRHVRFHAIQSMLLGILEIFAALVLSIISIPLIFIPILGWAVGVFLGVILLLVILMLEIFMMYKAFTGEQYKLPYIGRLAEDYA